MTNLSLVETKKSPQLDPSQLDWYKQPRRPLAEILADLAKPIPQKYLDKLKDKSRATYLPWFHACSLFDRCTGGHWDYQVTSIYSTPDRIYVTARITIYAQEGAFSRDGVGTELLKRKVTDEDTGETSIVEIAYGDPSSNAEQMAFKRAMQKFGLARYLKDKSR